MTIAALLVLDEFADQRQQKRWLVKLAARSINYGPFEHPLTILDLSQTGFRLETDEILRVNSSYVVELPSGVRKVCRRVWTDGRQHGAVFTEPLSDAELQSLAAHDTAVRFPPCTIRAASREHATSLHLPLANNWSNKEPKYPRGIRLLIGVGASAGLWGMIGAGLWHAIS